jgi:hypothetical protein
MGMCYIPVEVIDAVYLDRTRPLKKRHDFRSRLSVGRCYEAADKTGGARNGITLSINIWSCARHRRRGDRRYVRYWHKADNPAALVFVRYWTKADKVGF